MKDPLNGINENLDHLFEIGLVLVTVLSAAELQYASILLSGDTSGIMNLIFRVTTVPIIILIFLWLIKELYPSKLEQKLPLKRGLKEFCWIFLGNFIALDILVYMMLSFHASNAEVEFWGPILSIIAILLTFPVTLNYRKSKNENEPNKPTKRVYYLAVGEHAICSVLAYLIVLWLLEAMALAPL